MSRWPRAAHTRGNNASAAAALARARVGDAEEVVVLRHGGQHVVQVVHALAVRLGGGLAGKLLPLQKDRMAEEAGKARAGVEKARAEHEEPAATAGTQQRANRRRNCTGVQDSLCGSRLQQQPATRIKHRTQTTSTRELQQNEQQARQQASRTRLASASSCAFCAAVRRSAAGATAAAAAPA